MNFSSIIWLPSIFSKPASIHLPLMLQGQQSCDSKSGLQLIPASVGKLGYLGPKNKQANLYCVHFHLTQRKKDIMWSQGVALG